MDGEMIKTAARYVGTDTIIRHVAACNHLMAHLDKEASVGGKALEMGKKFITRPSSVKGVLTRRIGQLREGALGGAEEFGRRLLKPRYGLRKGWQEMAGTTSRARKLEGMGETASKLQRMAGEGRKGAREALKKQEDAILAYEKKTPHLGEAHKTFGEAWRAGGAKGVAEELSRSGWTGQGRVTKYLPTSQKALMAGFAASEIPGIVNAPAATPTGEGAALERLGGALGGTAGWIAGTGKMGLIPSAALWLAGEKAGKGLGRLADRLRSGASVGQAVTAPSPQEAREQLAKIYQTYGG